MTQTDVGGWRNNQAVRIGVAIRALRGGRSAQWLSDATAELGERVTRAVITDIELGHRNYVAVHEISLIATALGVPPLYLLMQGSYPDGPVEFLPGLTAPAWAVSAWWTDLPRYGGAWIGANGPDLPAPDEATETLLKMEQRRRQLRALLASAKTNTKRPLRDPQGPIRAKLAGLEMSMSDQYGGVIDGRGPFAVTLGHSDSGPVKVNLAPPEEGGSGPHMVIAGGPGSGKTSLAKEICRQLLVNSSSEVFVSANKILRKQYPEAVTFLPAPTGATTSGQFVAALEELLNARRALLRDADTLDVAEYRHGGGRMTDAFVVLDLDDTLDNESDLAVARVARTGGSLGVHLITMLPDPANTVVDPSMVPSVREATAWRLAGTVVRLGKSPGEGVCERYGATAPPPEKFRVLWQPGPG